MTGCDDDLDHVCAWGRWSSGDARNDATLVREPVREPVREAARPRVRAMTVAPAPHSRRGPRRLQLVADNGAPTRVLRPVV